MLSGNGHLPPARHGRGNRSTQSAAIPTDLYWKQNGEGIAIYLWRKDSQRLHISRSPDFFCLFPISPDLPNFSTKSPDFLQKFWLKM